VCFKSTEHTAFLLGWSPLQCHLNPLRSLYRNLSASFLIGAMEQLPLPMVSGIQNLLAMGRMIELRVFFSANNSIWLG